MLEEVKIKREMDRDMLIQVARTSLRTKVHQELADLLTEVIYKPLNEKTCLWSFLTRSDTNQAIQPQKMARGLKFRIQKAEGLYYLCTCSEKKMLNSCAVIAQLICGAFIFAYAKSRLTCYITKLMI